MKNYTANQPIKHDGTQYQVGDVIQLSDHDAHFLLLAGYVVEADEKLVTVETSLPQPAIEPESEKARQYDGWLKADLSAELTKRGIEHDPKAKNDELEQLLLDDDASKA